MKLIVGLGNPGEQYENTRHNLGFEVVDTLLHKLELSPDSWENSAKLKCLICKYKGKNEDLVFVKPQTFMNDSGTGVRAVMNFYKVKAEDVVIIHDDIDLKLGQLKVRQGGSSAGHKGVESVIEKLGTDNFIRFRLGIAPEQHSGLAKMAEHHKNSFNVEKFVVSPFDAHEKSKIKHLLKRAVLAVDILLKDGIASAQNQFN